MSLTKTSIRGTGPGDSINWCRNGVSPSGGGAKNLSSYINGLLAGRKKVPFVKSVDASVWSLSNTDKTIWRFAMHTSPFTTSLRAELMLAPPQYGSGGSAPTYQWTMWEALDGSGTETAHAEQVLGTYYAAAAGNPPSDWRFSSQTLTVSPDTDYVFQLAITDGLRVLSACVSEKPTHWIANGTTGGINTAGMGWGQPVTSAQVAAIIDGADLLWSRSGKHLFSWTEYSGIARTTATARNMLDQSLSAWAATNPGFNARPRYMGSLDSAVVPCTWCIYAKVAAGAGGTVDLIAESGTLDTLTVTSTSGAWYSGTFDLDSTATDQPLEVYLTGDGTNALTVYSASAWTHVA